MLLQQSLMGTKDGFPTPNGTPLLPAQSDKAKTPTRITERISLPPQYGKTLILRKLTPEEKEVLQGFKKGWTLVEE